MMPPQLYADDCLKVLPTLPEQSVDAVIVDLPYGMTSAVWDVPLPFELLWPEYERLLRRPHGVAVLFASQPFTSLAVVSQPQWFKYGWIWRKNRGSNFANAKLQPMKEHEDILVFAPEKPLYNPQRIPRSKSGQARAAYPVNGSNTGKREGLKGFIDRQTKYLDVDLRVPSSVLEFNVQVGLHPNQKPVDLLRYLVRTYTHRGMVVLDNTMGSGATGVAAILEGREFIGIEKDSTYFAIAEHQIRRAVKKALVAQEAQMEIDLEPVF